MRTPILLISFLALLGSVDASAAEAGCDPKKPYCGCPSGQVAYCDGNYCSCKDANLANPVNNTFKDKKLKK